MPVIVGNGHWNFDERLDPAKYVGFVYAIIDTKSGAFYIGKKNFWSKAGGRRFESNWKFYKSSSDTLQGYIKEDPTAFTYHVLEQYTAVGALAWAETWSLCHVSAPTNTRCINKRIEGISWGVKEPVTSRHRKRIEELLLWEK